MRYHPGGVDAVAGEAAGELVVDAAARHRGAGALDGGQRRRVAGAFVAAQQRLQQRRRRELGRAAEAARAVSSSRSTRGDRVVTQRRLHLGPAGGQPGRHRPQLADDLVGGLLDLVAPGPPGVGDGGKELQEVGLRVVGAAEERPAVGGQETGHRPTALAGQRDGGVHVDRVEVGPLLAVDLDAHEAGVHRGGHLVVLERLVGHHVAPVAGGVADRQQDRHVARRGLGQRLGRPLLPVHRVVGVLAQIRAGGARRGCYAVVLIPGALRSAVRSSVGALVDGLVGLGVLAVERLGQPLEVPVHRPHQQQTCRSAAARRSADRTGWPCRNPARCRWALRRPAGRRP